MNIETLISKFIKFTIVGLIGLIIDFSVTFLLKEVIKINKFIANGFGFIIAATANYFLNRVWTFQSQNQHIIKEYSDFIIVSLIGLLINTFILWLILKKFKLNFYVAKAIAIIVTTLWNFTANLLITFN